MTCGVIASTLLLAGCSGDGQAADTSPTAASVTTPEAVVATRSADEAVMSTIETEPTAADPTTEEPAAADRTAEETDEATSDRSAQATTQAAASTPALPRSEAEYADAWVRAWGMGDDAQMAAYADRYVHGEFSGTAGGGQWARQEWGSYEEGLVFVTYEDAGTGEGLFVLVDPGIVAIGAQHGVVSVARMPAGWDQAVPDSDDGGVEPLGLTTDIGEYADSWVRAWGAGDWDTATVYGTDDAMYLFGVDAAGGTDWARTGVSGTEVRYGDSGGNVLVLVLDADRVAAGAGDGVVAAYVQ